MEHNLANVYWQAYRVSLEKMEGFDEMNTLKSVCQVCRFDLFVGHSVCLSVFGLSFRK